MKRTEEVSLQLRTVSFLRILKSEMTYDELSDLTGLSVSNLNRYVNGHVLPGIERSRTLLETIWQDELREMLEKRIVRRGRHIDNTGVVFDQPFLDLVPPLLSESFDIGTPEVVLTAATDGISLATAIASYHDIRAVYAKEKKETGVENFIELSTTLEAGIGLTYFLPESSLRSGQKVLIVDDLIRSGETQELLLDFTEEVRADVIGIFTMIAVGSLGMNTVKDRADAPVQALKRIEPARNVEP